MPLQLLEESLADTTAAERRQQRRLAAIVADPALRELTFALTDEVLRFDDSRRAAQRFRAIVHDLGVPSSLGSSTDGRCASGAVAARVCRGW